MNRETYIRKVKKQLDCSVKEKEEIVRDLQEIFDSGKEHEKSVPEKRQKTFRHAFLRPILLPSCSELTQNKNTIII